jgi:hypothetical protein
MSLPARKTEFDRTSQQRLSEALSYAGNIANANRSAWKNDFRENETGEAEAGFIVQAP